MSLTREECGGGTQAEQRQKQQKEAAALGKQREEAEKECEELEKQRHEIEASLDESGDGDNQEDASKELQ